MRASSFLLFTFVSSLAFAAEVIDLGSFEIQVKVRGPEIQLIESNRVGDEAALQMSRWQLKNMERELLEPDDGEPTKPAKLKQSGRKKR